MERYGLAKARERRGQASVRKDWKRQAGKKSEKAGHAVRLTGSRSVPRSKTVSEPLSSAAHCFQSARNAGRAGDPMATRHPTGTRHPTDEARSWHTEMDSSRFRSITKIRSDCIQHISHCNHTTWVAAFRTSYGCPKTIRWVGAGRKKSSSGQILPLCLSVCLSKT